MKATLVPVIPITAKNIKQVLEKTQFHPLDKIFSDTTEGVTR